MNWANLVTYFRLLFIPLVVVSYHSELVHSNVYAALFFTIASLSDWLDGYVFALSGPIYAGTNEIQRNIIAERVLGLPRR